jgi:hypothetical protein
VVDSYKYYYFCTKFEQGQYAMDTLFRSITHTSNCKYVLATGKRKETVKIKKGHKISAHVIRKVVVCDIADGTGLAGVCKITTDGFGP